MAVRKGYRQTTEHVRRRTDARLATLKAKPKPASREWLEREYVTKRRTCNEIAADLSRDPKTVWTWLKHYGIPTRPRGGSTASGSFKKGGRNAFAGRRHSAKTKARLRELRSASPTLPHLKDGTHWLASKPKSEHPNWKGGITPERQAFYASPEWREACRAVWRRADAKCERCGADHRESGRRGTFHVHHIASFAVRELRAEVDNLALLCGDCHRFVHGKANTGRELIGAAKC